jgi:crotonobetainyl-CoA:carnitine CoA-transferase CaiB-like acyl-CoA transferase
MPGSLSGLTVLDTTRDPQGAITTMLLADYGARVIKLEPPGPRDEPAWLARARKAWDRGKWSITLDTTTPAGSRELQTLLPLADILVTSATGPDAARIGLDDDALLASHPTLVHCRISAYGIDGPHADRPANEALVAARWGMMGEQRGHRPGPKFLGHPNVLYGTGLLGAIGSLAAIRSRRLTGRGQRVDVSLLDSVLAQSPMNWWWNETGASYLAREGGEEGFGRNRILLGLFPAGDGEYLMLHSGGEGGFKRVMDLLGLGDGVVTVVGEAEMGVPLDDHELAQVRRVPEALLTRSRDEWVAALHAADIAAVPVHRPGEPLFDDQVEFAGLRVTVEDPELGRLYQVGPPIRFSGVDPVAPTPAPAPGTDDARRGELVRDASRVTPVPTSAEPLGAPLEGVRVLDFASFFATAYGSKILSDLGADVIKIEPLAGDPMRPLPNPFEASQRGKRSLCIDLKSASGQRVALELARQADVVMHNLRPGKADKIGLGPEQVRAVNPDIIYCYLPGWGSRGPKAHLKSFAPLLSGFCGLLYEGGGAGNAPVQGVMGNEDYYNGFLGALGVVAALEQRARTGTGIYLESPQLHSALFATTHEFVDDRRQLVPTLCLDATQTGFSPLYRIYEVADGWVAIACTTGSDVAALARALDISPAELARADDDVAATIGKLLADEPVDAVLARLQGVPCERVLEAPYMPEFLWDEWGLESGRIYEQHHATYGWIREVGRTIHLSREPGVNKGPGPLLGEHTREILAEAGLSPVDVEALVGTVVKVSEA